MGKDLNTRLISVENAGYVTQSALAPYALRSEIPSLEPYFLSSNFTKSNIKATLGISDWALASAKPTYTASEVGALGVNGTAQSALKMKPEYLTDLNNATPWRFFDMNTGYGSTDGNKPNIAWVSGITGTASGSSNYRWQLAMTTGSQNPYFRREHNGNWNNWSTLAFTSNIPTRLSQLTDDVVAGKYLPLSGGTLTDALTVKGSGSPLTVHRTQPLASVVKFVNTDGNLGCLGVDVDKTAIFMEASGVINKLLHTGNYSNLLAGGTINGGMTFASGNLVVSNGHTVVGELYPKNDGSIDLGQGSRKWKDVYLGGYLTWGNSVDSTDLGDWEALKDNIGLRIISSKTSDSGAPYQYATALHVRGRYGFELAVQGGDIDSFAIRSVTNNRGWNRLLHSGNYSSYALSVNGGTVNGSVYMNGYFLLGNSQPIMVADTNGVYQSALYLSIGNNFLIGYGTSVVGKRRTVLLGNIIEFKSNGGEDNTLVLNADRTATFSSTVSAPSFIGNLTGNADSATKLATPRTIWGQPFDGTQDITGALTAPSITTNSLTIGGVTLTYDSVNEALCINGKMYALGGITAGGAGISAYTSLESRVARLEQQLNVL